MTDKIGDVKATLYHQSLLGTHSLPKYFLFGRWPVLAGVLAFKIRNFAYMRGLDLCNMWGSILNAGHLYNFCQMVGKGDGSKVEWADMETVFRMQGKERLFKGKVPVNESETPLHLAFTERFPESGDVARCTRAWGGTNIERVGSVIGRIGELIRDLGKDGRLGKCIVDNYQSQMELEERLRRQGMKGVEDYSKVLEPFINAKRFQSPRQTPTQFLTTFKQAFRLEIPYQNFNYISFHTRCFSIFQNLLITLPPDITEYKLRTDKEMEVGPNAKLRLPANLPNLVVLLGCAVHADCEIGKAMGGKGRNGDSETLRSVARMMKEFVGREGGKESEGMERVS
ncbi:hypothetical protein HDV00_006006 [Rhizophlyctis rosea]|nr:hypothetical protein HDV00_006006 [Rhizophlyctis rosea]